MDIDISNFINIDENFTSLSNKESEYLEGHITKYELLSALKSMKHGKSPGSDGYTVEFFKVFWFDIKSFVTRSVRYAYDNEELSITQKHGVIQCLPKGDKPREFLKTGVPLLF